MAMIMDAQNWKQLSHEMYRFFRYTLKRFLQDDGLETAGLLSYTTLLSLVPLLALVLAAVSAFPVFDQWSEEIQDFVFRNFVPTAGETIQQNLNQFVDKASKLTAAGILFLIFTALILMSNIERHLNRIFRVKYQRSLQNRLIVYWSTLTLGPMLLGASFALSSYIFSLPFIHDAAEGLVGIQNLLKLTPALVASLAFTLMFIIVPNRGIRWHNAFAGGVVAALLLEAAKSGFVFYVTHFPTYNKIYGAVASIPIFLVWMYLSWVVILFGANFTASLAEPREQWQSSKRPIPATLAKIWILWLLWQAFQKGESLTDKALNLQAGLSPSILDEHIEWLKQQQLLTRLESGHWSLQKDLKQVSIADLLSQSDEDLLGINAESSLPEAHWAHQIAQAMLASKANHPDFYQQSIEHLFESKS